MRITGLWGSLVDLATIGGCVVACWFTREAHPAEMGGIVDLARAGVFGLLFAGVIVIPRSRLTGDRHMGPGRCLWFAYPSVLLIWGASANWFGHTSAGIFMLFSVVL